MAANESAVAMQAADVPTQNVAMAHAVRVIAALSSDPKTPCTPKAIAKAAGLAEREVVHVWRQPWFGEYLRDTSLGRLGALLPKAVTRLDQIVSEDDVKPETHLRAVQLSVDLFAKLNEACAKQDARADAEKLQERVKEAIAKVREAHAQTETKIEKMTDASSG